MTVDASRDPADEEPQPDPSRTPLQTLRYLLSLPERAVRTGTGLMGGVLRESAELVVPRSFQCSQTYTVMVRQMLDFLVHDVGGVASTGAKSSTSEIDNYVARKAVGNFVDMASLATLHVSPLMILAAISDLAHGSKIYLDELTKELKAQGVIDPNASVNQVQDLLSAVSNASAATSQVFNTPPLSVESLQATLDQARQAVAGAGSADMPSQEEVAQVWQEMRDISEREGVNILAVSGAATMRSLPKLTSVGRGALSTVKVAGSLFDRHVLDHYQQSLKEIRQRGFYQSLAETSEPYIDSVWTNFQPAKSTLTENLLSGKLAGSAWRAARRWLGREDEPTLPEASPGSLSEPPPAAAPPPLP